MADEQGESYVVTTMTTVPAGQFIKPFILTLPSGPTRGVLPDPEQTRDHGQEKFIKVLGVYCDQRDMAGEIRTYKGTPHQFERDPIWFNNFTDSKIIATFQPGSTVSTPQVIKDIGSDIQLMFTNAYASVGNDHRILATFEYYSGRNQQIGTVGQEDEGYGAMGHAQS